MLSRRGSTRTSVRSSQASPVGTPLSSTIPLSQDHAVNVTSGSTEVSSRSQTFRIVAGQAVSDETTLANNMPWPSNLPSIDGDATSSRQVSTRHIDIVDLCYDTSEDEASQIVGSMATNSTFGPTARTPSTDRASCSSRHELNTAASPSAQTSSYATSFASPSLRAISDGTLSPLTSDHDHENGDRAQTETRKRRRTAQRPFRNIQAEGTPERTTKFNEAQRLNSSADTTPTSFSPSRRSARIETAGSSLQKALQRRDELDDKLMGKPRASIPITSPALSTASQAVEAHLAPTVPVKRPRGRPRKSAPATLLPRVDQPKAVQQQDLAVARRSTRRSMPALIASSNAQAKPTKLVQVDANDSDTNSGRSAATPVVINRRPGRPRKSESVAVPAPPSSAGRSQSAASNSAPAKTVTSTAVSAGTPVVVKRRPGRPRKSESAAINTAALPAAAQTPVMEPASVKPHKPEVSHIASTIVPAKRRPGRPRKSEPDIARLVPGPAAAPGAPQPAPSTPAGIRYTRSIENAVSEQLRPRRSAAVRTAVHPVTVPARARTPVTEPTPLTSTAAVVSSPMVKRGPGRPRKSVTATVLSPPVSATLIHQSDVAMTAASPDTVGPTPWTRGSKRAITEVDSTASEPSPPKKRRGRPPKRPIASPLRDETSTLPSDSKHAASPMQVDVFDDGRSDLSDLSDPPDTMSSSPRKQSPNVVATGESDKRPRVRRSEKDKDGKQYYASGLYAPSTGSAAASGVLQALPLPMHFGDRLLSEEREFSLPSSLHAESERLRERVNAKRKPPPYQQIRSNKYYSRPMLRGERPECCCKPEDKCGPDCMNRMLMFICDPKTCPCGEECTNISLGKRPTVKMTVTYYGGRGFGLQTLEPIKKDDFIDEYRGEIIDLPEMYKRVNEEYKATGNFYLLDYDFAAGEFLDGGRKGNVTRFANHSCDPNCRIEKFIIRGTGEQLSAEFQFGLFALRDIAAGEELTYNYGWSAFQPRDRTTGEITYVVPNMPCLCGASNCSLILGAKKPQAAKLDKVADLSKKLKGRKKRKQAADRKASLKASLASAPTGLFMPSSQKQLQQLQQSVPTSGKHARRLHKVGGHESRRDRTAVAAVKLAAKVATKRAERKRKAIESGAVAGLVAASAPSAAAKSTTIMAASPSRDTPSSPNTGPSASTPAVLESPVKRKPGRPRKHPLPAVGNVSVKQSGAAATTTTAAIHRDDSSSSMPVPAEAILAAASSPPSLQQRSRSLADPQQPALLPLDANLDLASPRHPPSPSRSVTASPTKGLRLPRAAVHASNAKKDRRWSAVEAVVSEEEDQWMSEYEGSDADDEHVAPHLHNRGNAQSSPRDGTKQRSYGVPRRRGPKPNEQFSPEEAERQAMERRARNAFMARVRRASKRGIVVQGPEHHPLRKVSIQCTSAPENTYIPDLPSSLITLGMSTADARRARNAFLARVRRAMKRGHSKEEAIQLAAKPLPGDPASDTPVMRAQRAQMEQVERDAASELRATEGMPEGEAGSYDSHTSHETAFGADPQASVWQDVTGWSSSAAAQERGSQTAT